MRVLSNKDVPIGLGILLGVLTWISSQLYVEVRDRLIATDGMIERQEDGHRVVVYHLTNESLSRSLVPLQFSLRCPGSTTCFSPTFDSAWKTVDAEQVAPWNVSVKIQADLDSASITVQSLPPRGTVQLLLSIPQPGVFPLFYYNARDANAAVPAILPPSNPLVFVARHYLELLAMALVAVVSLALWWMLAPE